MTLETLPIVQAHADHRNFILATWVKSYEAQARRQGLRDFYARCEPALAEAHWSTCSVLTDDGGFTVHGWASGKDGELRHCYVVPELRRIRVATCLIKHACGDLRAYARPWPYVAHAPVNPYLLGDKNG